MPRSSTIATIFLCIFSMLPYCLPAQGIAFEQGKWNSILAKAGQENKLIFLDAYTTWCGPCKWMAKNTFTDSVLAAYYNKHFINVKMDMEKEEGLELAKRYDISAYPTLLYVNGQGQVMHRVVGAMDPARALTEGDIALDPEQNLAAYQQKYNAGVREPAFLLTLLNRLSVAGLEREEVADTYLGTQPPHELSNPRNWQIIYQQIHSPFSHAFDHLVAQSDAFAALYTADMVEQKINKVFYESLINTALQGELQAYERLKNKVYTSGWKGGKKLLMQVEIELSKARAEWELYARAVIAYLAQYPSSDPNELNGHAWAFYEHVEDTSQLVIAEAWVLRALALKQTYSILDTYAALLYKLGKKEHAIMYAEKAIAEAIASGEDYRDTEELLRKIKLIE